MLTDKLSVSHTQWAHMVAPTDSMVWCCMVAYRLYTSCVYSSPAVAHVLPLLPMVWPGAERDDPSGDGWKGCWTLVLMILARTRRERRMSADPGRRRSGSAQLRMKPSAVTLWSKAPPRR